MDERITKGTVRNILTRVVPSLKKRPDPEHEQAVIRIFIGFIAGIYLLVVMDTDNGNFQVISITGMILFFIFAFAITSYPRCRKSFYITGNFPNYWFNLYRHNYVSQLMIVFLKMNLAEKI